MRGVSGQLSRLVGLPKMVRVTRGFAGDPTQLGFVLGIGGSLVLLHQFHDFYAEGYTTLRIADVERIRTGEQERFLERIIIAEGLLGGLGIPYPLTLDDMRSLLSDLYERGHPVVVECEGRETSAHDEYYIGQIVAVGNESLKLLYFNAVGKWDSEPSVIAFPSITRVQFDTPYINTIIKYLKEPPPNYGGYWL
jgi:hypothetical protein